MIRYRVRRDRLEENLRLLRAVHEELAATAPDGLRYASYQLDDEVSFVDLAVTDRPGRFSQLDAWAAFRSTLAERCDEPPVLEELHEVAAYDRR